MGINKSEADPKLTILMYHSLDDSGSVVSVAPDAFAQQMSWLAKMKIRGVSLRQAVAYRKSHGVWPTGAVAVTFDDGFANFFKHALSALDRHGFSATVYVVTGHVGKQNDWAPPPGDLGAQPMLSWDQIKQLDQAGIEIGAHTVSHPDLRQLTQDQVREEIVTSKQSIEQALGKKADTFAYPYGLYGPAAAGVAKQAFQASCTTLLKRADTDPINELPRVDMFYIQTQQAMQELVTGRMDKRLTLRRWARALRRAMMK